MPEIVDSLRCRGMRDLLPPEMARFRRVEEAFLRTCRSWGYEEVRTPTIEYLHLFTAAGTLSPQTLHRVYSFLDWDGWSGERVVLRPEGTIPAARLYTEHLDGGRTARLCYVQNVFSFATDDEPREAWQCGVELIGPTGLRGDIELVLLGLEVLQQLGLEQAEVVLSHAGLVRAVLAKTGLPPEEQVRLYDRLLDGDLSVLEEIESRLPDLGAPLRLLFDVPGVGAGYLANVRASLLPALPGLQEPLDQLEALCAALEGLGQRYRIQAALARRFEYYSGPVFRFLVGGTTVGGGGRYDGLLELIGGRAVPASGFALQVGALAEFIAGAEQEVAMPILVRPEDEGAEALTQALRVAQGLRAREIVARLATAGETGEREVLVSSEGTLTVRIAGEERTVEGVGQAASLLGVPHA
jgi:histidyl-tRNA synthetase